MIRYIEEDAVASRERGEEGKVNLPHFFFLMPFNLVGNLVLSRDLLSSRSKEGKEFFDAMNEGATYIRPCQEIKRNMVREMGRAMKIMSSFVEDRIDEVKLRKEKPTKDLLDALLEHTGEGTISNQNEMFFAGSETTSSTMEWAMAELLRNPESMKKAKEELDRVIGVYRKIEEGDMDNLSYLQAVTKETLRLHPALPLLIPRNGMRETNYFGYLIPRRHRSLGQNFELIPFGSGRRICVGISLAHKVVHLALASLLYYFDWELGNNMSPEAIDMNKRFGITVIKLIPLEAISKKRVMYP
ncbi:putative cytochrome P450 [Hibiscus syriacus]|uniref:Cytochrome P450 n=1 Tax=Hibiscus syriacus TaxID=106335 RepID=A0A6A2WWI6_HIBSY|nr:putative cytochrome P450 [Hibiscus syriacus]